MIFVFLANEMYDLMVANLAYKYKIITIRNIQ
jgi:hypothetical protein